MNVPRAALGLLVAAGVVVLIIVLLGGGGSSGYEVKLNFRDADGLLTGSRVEIGGVGVGEVKSLKVTAQDHALVTVAINRADAPIGTNATAVIRPADLLGEKYVDLSVGDRGSQPARSGFTVSDAHTQTATDFDQIVDVLGPSEQDRLAILVHETAVALDGRGADVAALLRALPPSLTDAQSLISQVTASNAQLQGLIDHASGVMAALASNQHTLEHFVSTAAGALDATARHTADLEQTVAEAPGLLGQLDTTLENLDSAGDNLRPAARGLDSTAPALTATLEALPGFTSAALPALAEIKSISPQLVALGRRSSPVVAELEPTLQRLDALVTASKPVTNSLNSGIDNLMGTLQGWARALQETDGLSHEFRVSAEFPTSLVTELAEGLAGSVTSSARKPSGRGAAHGGGSKATGGSAASGTGSSGGSSGASSSGSSGSGAAGAVGGLLHGVTGTLGGVTSKLGLTPTSTTGSSSSTSSSSAGSGSLSNLLGYLLGGK